MLDFTHSQTFIFIGRSGSGKGTQAELLQNYIAKHDKSRPLVYLETGHLFRDFIQGDSFAARQSHAVYERNDRQPDFLAAWMWSHIMIEKFSGNEHVIIDGTPRSLPEAKILDTALSFFFMNHVHIVYLDIPRAEAEKRLKERGRSDDVLDEAVEKRLNWFDADVMPAVEYYANSADHHYIHIDGTPEPDIIHQDIVEKLNE